MATDNKFTELIKQWLDTPAEERDYTVGALYLLKLSGNQIMYRNIMANPVRKAEFIEYNIRKYYNFRVQALTHKSWKCRSKSMLSPKSISRLKRTILQRISKKVSVMTSMTFPTIFRLSMWRTFLSCSVCVKCI